MSVRLCPELPGHERSAHPNGSGPAAVSQCDGIAGVGVKGRTQTLLGGRVPSSPGSALLCLPVHHDVRRLCHMV